MDFQAHKTILLKDPKVLKALKDSEVEYKIARALILARLKKRITQKDLAYKLNTKQSVISRVENALTTPSLSFLKRLAEALNMKLTIDLK
ncbi:helix-turn-helix transcriptional regulator [Candidatus Gottesmanbacteria bacterium]|nr:helix-turn-helix transcriptional regulator [Candidatus Gottesmanbacteria bacterium]